MFKHTFKSKAVGFHHGVDCPASAGPIRLAPLKHWRLLGRRGLMPVTLAALLALMLLTPALPLLPNRAQAADGDLDPTFGTGGKVVTDFFGGNDQAIDVVIDANDKIVTAGFATTASAATDFALARYNPDGSRDSTFGKGGKVTTDFAGRADRAFSVVTQSDGRIIAAGFTTNSDNTTDFALARYNPDGSLDLTFGAGGKVMTDFGPNDIAESAGLQPDGKIVTAGTDGKDFALARHNADGSLDGAFGTGGKVTTDFSGQNDFAADSIILSDGKLVAAGQAGTDFGVARYNSNGSLDPTFGASGKVMTDFAGRQDFANATMLQPDGKLLVAGNADNGVGRFIDFAAARYNPDGTLDTAFGTGGRVTTDFSGLVDQGFALLLQPKGKFIICGLADNRASLDFALARYNSDGSLDTAFGTGGRVTVDFVSGSTDLAFAAAQKSDGKIVAAGVTFRRASAAQAVPQGDGCPECKEGEEDCSCGDNRDNNAVIQVEGEKPACELACPADVCEIDDFSRPVSYSSPLLIGGACSGYTITCLPPSGEFFRPGQTEVKCEATGPDLPTLKCSFKVLVNSPNSPKIKKLKLKGNQLELKIIIKGQKLCEPSFIELDGQLLTETQQTGTRLIVDVTGRIRPGQTVKVRVFNCIGLYSCPEKLTMPE
ncbi:MAG: delta-60 repeat domain-containing protein [Acidobacteriota bacterium]